jgi:hypothetical protein
LLKTVKLALLCTSVFWLTAAWAVEMPTLFTAEVPFDQLADDPRKDAYEAALREVLTRVSGSELTNDTELVEQLFPNPAAYVVRFRKGAADTMAVTFDGEAVERVLRQAGQTVWGSDRPLTLVWLAVDWGQGQREIIAADDADATDDEGRSIDRNRMLRERILDVAQRRGLPVVFPLLDTTDMQSVSFSDVWGGFDEDLLEASKRYDVQSVLIGRIRPESGQRNRWNYHFGGEDRAWSGEPELVLNQIAELLAREFAIGADSPIRMVKLTVSGIVSVEHYGEVQKMLADTNIIDRFAVTRVEGDSLHYDVAVHGGTERLRRALRFGGLLEEEDKSIDFYGSPDPVSEELKFFYNP